MQSPISPICAYADSDNERYRVLYFESLNFDFEASVSFECFDSNGNTVREMLVRDVHVTRARAMY